MPIFTKAPKQTKRRIGKVNEMLKHSLAKAISRRLVYSRNGISYHKCLSCMEIEKNGLEFNLNRKPKPANKPFPHMSLCGEKGKF
jgi:hypothetical protein